MQTIAMPTHDLFSDWLAVVSGNAGMAGAELRWRICVADKATMVDGGSAVVARRCAESAAAAAWAEICGANRELPRDALRAGPGPRFGSDSDIDWAASLAHSARAAAAVAGFIAQASQPGERLLLGIDLERQDRGLRPHVSRVLCPRIEGEPPPVRLGDIPLLAVACIKEAAFKSDAAQSGRAVWDYDIVMLERTGPAGWAGHVRAIHEDRPRFHVGVHEIASYWVAMSVAVTPARLLAGFA